jgi:hypothetical protein
MPRLAPTEIVEQRITFGNYERQFVTDVKNDIEKTVKVAAITAAAVPLATVAGLGLMGYGIYKGASMNLVQWIGKPLQLLQISRTRGLESSGASIQLSQSHQVKKR